MILRLGEIEVEAGRVLEREASLLAVRFSFDNHKGSHESLYLKILLQLCGVPHLTVLLFEFGPHSRLSVQAGLFLTTSLLGWVFHSAAILPHYYDLSSLFCGEDERDDEPDATAEHGDTAQPRDEAAEEVNEHVDALHGETIDHAGHVDADDEEAHDEGDETDDDEGDGRHVITEIVV